MKASAFANEDPVPFNPSLIDGKYLVCQPNQQFIHINSERNLMSKIYVLAFVFRLGFVEFNLSFSLYHQAPPVEDVLLSHTLWPELQKL